MILKLHPWSVQIIRPSEIKFYLKSNLLVLTLVLTVFNFHNESVYVICDLHIIICDLHRPQHGNESEPTVSQQRIQPILRITQNFIVAMLLRYSYVQEHVIVEIFYLALLYFQYPVTGEQSTSSIISVFAKPNHQ